ncbi:DUF4169 family protein [Ochrobactrum sp. SFR4]|uniref:DUF4169 family protein n=1 Tax=Ochrobactrum sp. SFR4 TaxID=2717368 RepID=UPI001C8CE1FE|nr:DUF4169 family protein [Ochrobactrum sp. SFR4]MBX8826204.1 DUF4169 family protein [Ochrobactrum sp. SFR4]
MSDIINLKQFKKRKARATKEVEANTNRILFGRTKAEKSFDKNQNEKQVRFLDRNRLEPRGPASADETE